MVSYDSVRLDCVIAKLWNQINQPGIQVRYPLENLTRIPSKRIIPYLQQVIDSSGFLHYVNDADETVHKEAQRYLERLQD